MTEVYLRLDAGLLPNAWKPTTKGFDGRVGGVLQQQWST